MKPALRHWLELRAASVAGGIVSALARPWRPLTRSLVPVGRSARWKLPGPWPLLTCVAVGLRAVPLRAALPRLRAVGGRPETPHTGTARLENFSVPQRSPSNLVRPRRPPWSTRVLPA